MDLVNPLKMFGKKSLKKISIDELRRNKIALEQHEAKFIKKVSALEQQKKELLRRGAELDSELEMKVAARKIKEKDTESRSYDRNLQFINQNLRILGGLIQIKENAKLLKQCGLSHLVDNMDLAELQKYIEEATVEGTFEMVRLQEVLGVVDGDESIRHAFPDDRDINDIMATMLAIKNAGDDERDQVAESALREINTRLAQVTHEETH